MVLGKQVAIFDGNGAKIWILVMDRKSPVISAFTVHCGVTKSAFLVRMSI